MYLWICHTLYSAHQMTSHSTHTRCGWPCWTCGLWAQCFLSFDQVPEDLAGLFIPYIKCPGPNISPGLLAGSSELEIGSRVAEWNPRT